MAASPALQAESLLSLDEYLNTSYHPDCDFVDGRLEHRRPPEGFYTEKEIEELFVGEWEHNRIQMLMGMWFGMREEIWPMKAVTEQRIYVSPTRIRVCDVCLVRAEAPRERVTLTAPLLCVEILSPKDRLSRAKIVLEDYRRMGVPNIWLIDPIKRLAWTFDTAGLHPVPATRLAIPDTEIYLPLADLLAKLA
jgi:Uma2 family endonuclease